MPPFVKVLVASSLFVVALPYLSRQITVDVAPLARITLADGTDLNPHARLLELASPYALTDGLVRPDHYFEFPPGTRSLRLDLPAAFKIGAVGVVSQPRRDAAPLVVEFSSPPHPHKTLNAPWSLRRDRPALCWMEAAGTPAAAIRCVVQGDAMAPWNSVTIVTSQPRGLAWLYALALTIVLPAVAALLVAFGLVGFGAWSQDIDAGATVVRGVLAAAAVAVVWTLVPRSSAVDAIFVAGWIGFGARGFRLMSGVATQRRLLVLAALLLSVQIEVESYAYSDLRVSPMDHVLGYFGAQRLSRELPMPAELSRRPWLLHVLAAPWDHIFGRFGYWGYLGVVAGVNSLSVLLAAAILRRLGVQNRVAAVGWFVLLPGFVNFHFLGQRLLGGTLAVAAVTWLLGVRRDVDAEAGNPAPTPTEALTAGLAFVLGIGLHPSVAFVLVTTALLWLLKPRGGRGAFLLGIALPGVLYAVWLVAMGTWFPGQRNDLLFYPLMKDLNDQFPPGASLADAARSLSMGDWWTLAYHRLLHVRHYLWTDNWVPASWALGRWISLPNVLSWAGLLLLLLRWPWRERATWCGWTVLAPLAFHHLFIGHSNPQFHISPAPFLALLLLTAATLADASARPSPWVRLLRFAVAVEIAARLLWPIVAVKLQADHVESMILALRLVGTDMGLYFAIAALPALCGWLVARTIRNGPRAANAGELP